MYLPLASYTYAIHSVTAIVNTMLDQSDSLLLVTRNSLYLSGVYIFDYINTASLMYLPKNVSKITHSCIGNSAVSFHTSHSTLEQTDQLLNNRHIAKQTYWHLVNNTHIKCK